MAFAEVGDVRLFFTDEGTGEPTILFVHGFSCDIDDWMWQLPYFESRHRVVAVDLRGHGRSSAPEKGYESRDLANDLAGLIELLGCGPVVAVGHSLGGMVVTALAVEHPDLVQAVVSVDPGYLLPPETYSMLEGMFAGFEDDAVTTVQTILGSSYTDASPDYLKPWHRRRVAGVPPHVLRDTGLGLFGDPDGLAYMPAATEYLKRRSCPVLAIYAHPGRADVEAPLLTDDAQSKALAWEGSGHWLHQERPDEFNELVETWISSLGS